MNKIVLLLMILSCGSQIWAASCCGASSSSVAQGHPSIDQGNFLVFTGGDYGRSPSLDYQGVRISFGVAYGITDRFAVSLRSSYAWLQASIFKPGIFDTTVVPTDTIRPNRTNVFENNGFGDGSLGVQFIIIPQTPLTKQELKVGATVELPWGTPDKKTIVETVETLLPPKAQTGSGSAGAGGFVAYSRRFPAIHLAGSTTLGGSVWFTDRNGITRGPEVNATATAIVGPFWDFKGLASLGYGNTSTTRLVGDVLDLTTGGQRLTLIPGIDYLVDNRAQFLLNASVPVWQDSNQKKIGNSLSVSLSAVFYLPGLFVPEE